MNNLKVLSVGGSIIIPSTGFDIPFLKAFRALILKRIKNGEKFIIVVGGGSTCRNYQNAAKSVLKLENADLDWIGIATTLYNAEFVKWLFKGFVHKDILTNPTKKVTTNKPIIVAAGWKPGFTTDHSAVCLARAYGIKEVYNLSNISYVYTKDPNKFKDAVKIERTNWKHFRSEVIPKKHVAGMNTPFDPMASKVADANKLKVSFVDGRNLKEFARALEGKKFQGTIIE